MLKLATLAGREDFSFGPLRVSPALRLISGPAGQLHVEPLTMHVFLLLVDARGQVVTRERLYDECWGGADVGDHSLNRVITMVRRIAATAAPGAFRIESVPRTGYRLLADANADTGRAGLAKWGWPLAGVAAASAIALLGWSLLGSRPAEPSATVVGADVNSAELARSISDATIRNAAAYGIELRVVTPSAGRRPTDFVLTVRQANGAGRHGIELALADGHDRSLLWSWSAAAAVTPAEALDQEVRAIGAAVLTCAAETQADGRRADEEAVKLYLDACSRFDGWHAADLALIADAFDKVTARAPQLRGAWSKLFLSKAEAIEGYPAVDLSNSLKHDIANARARGIEVPETYIARAAVLPFNARFERLSLYEAGLKRYPGDPFLLAARSWQLRSVGRMDEAARTAKRWVTLYPESAAAQSEFVQSLMSSGRVGEARKVLDAAMQSAPGAPNVQGVRWMFETRYGDPKVALQLARSGNAVVEEAVVTFLEARMDPTKAKVDRAIDSLTAAYRADPKEPGFLAQALGMFGRTEDAIQLLLRYDGSNSGDGAEMLFRPNLREVRRDRRFMAIARNFGVTDYWVKSGILPDFCFEPGLPYDCKRELARLARLPRSHS